MRTHALIAAALLATAATAASAQRYYDNSWPDRTQWRGEQECWNSGAGHFERVRPGEVQNDLDLRNCRSVGAYAYNERYVERPVYIERPVYVERPVYRDHREECWNPRQRHYEEVRRGERQDDLDYSRCRIQR